MPVLPGVEGTQRRRRKKEGREEGRERRKGKMRGWWESWWVRSREKRNSEEKSKFLWTGKIK